jgi:hypothetical protein
VCTILFGQPGADIQLLSIKDVPSLEKNKFIQKKFCDLGRVHTDGSQSKIFVIRKKKHLAEIRACFF